MIYTKATFLFVLLGIVVLSCCAWLIAPTTHYVAAASSEIKETHTETPPTLHSPFTETITNKSLPEEEFTLEATIQSSVIDAEDITQVPFYSQFADISDPSWKKIGCGIAGLAMLIDFYKPAVPVDTLLQEGIAAGAYLDHAGWTYAGLIGVSEKYGLTGSSHDLGGQTMETAFQRFTDALREGPVMASVYYTFTPGHPIPHLVIINDIDGDTLYYNDPAEPTGGGTISVADFKAAWKKRYIEFWPTS